ARPLQGPSQFRGIGTYFRGLFTALLSEGYGSELALLMDRDLPLPELPEGDYVIFRVRRRYHGRFAPYEDAVMLPGELLRIQPRLFHATTLSLPLRHTVPLVATVHDLIPWVLKGRRMWGDRIRYTVGRRGLCRAAAIITPSESTACDAVRLAGVDRKLIRVVPEAVEANFRPVHKQNGHRWQIEQPFLLFLGALDARKDPAALLEAWQVARQSGAECELVLAGAAGRQAPREMAGARRLGYIPTAELPELLSAAACLIFPSRYEGFGLSLLEAMACGCPVVAYNNSSLPEVVGKAGVLVSDGDAAALGRAATEYLLNPGLAEQASRNGLQQAAKFSWQRAARATMDVYQDLF
ncbi:MAG: glycosyltransferase family 4 protein, partial [Candidatus Dormibacteraceae bacterium]